MWLKRTTAHFRPHGQYEVNIEEEVETASTSNDVRTLTPLSRDGIEYIKQSHPLVKSEADLDVLVDSLKGSNEIGFSPLFDPKLVDASCKRGIFPLALSIGQNYFVYGPKLHVKRAVCVFDAANTKLIGTFEEGVCNVKKLAVSKKLLKTYDSVSKRPCFTVFINRKEDLRDVLQLIWEQHGENWLCKALRLCILYMFFHPEQFTTKILITAIRRTKYDNSEATGTDTIQEGELVSCEVGFVVGDIYSSATGAYTMSGAGSLQLAATASIIQKCGCSVWDLGMDMKYKHEVLGSVEIPRKRWVKLVKSRQSYSLDYNKLENYKNGISVLEALK